MTLNWLGLVAAVATFLGVWFGHVGVRKIESISPTIGLPAVIALAVGMALEVGALISDNLFLSAALGIVGMTVLWDALEFRRQHKRVRIGHAPANPNNPRHARLLAEGKATTIDWLDRDAVGRPVTPEEALKRLHVEERIV